MASGTFGSNFAVRAVQEAWKSSEKLSHGWCDGGSAGKAVHPQT